MTATTQAPPPVDTGAPPPPRPAPRRSRDPRTVLALVSLLLGGNGIVLAYRMAEDAEGQGHFALFWLSYALVLLGTLALVLRVRTSAARLATLAAFGFLTFVPKLLMTLDGPRYFDEYGHWRHLKDMLDVRAVFVDTPYLPIQRGYPGLQVLTSAVHTVTGLGTWHAGLVVVLAAHVGVLLVIWWMARQLDLSTRAAAVVALLYALNPSYLYFDTQFSYESLGLPLCFTATALAIGARRAWTAQRAWSCAVGGSVAAAACIATHHNAAFVMIVLLAVTAAFVPRRADLPALDGARWAPWVLLGVGLVFLVGWLGAAAGDTFGYLEPHLRNGVGDTLNYLRGTSSRQFAGEEIKTTRTLFGGSTLPLYEIVCGFLAPLLVLGGLAYGFLDFRRDRAGALRHVRLFAPFYALLLLYLASLPLVLSASGAETAHRAWGFGYLGVATVLVATSGRLVDLAEWLPRRRVAIIAAALLLVVAIGNTAAGQNVYYRFPGPEVFGTDTRSRTAELDGVASWMDRNLAPGTKVFSDRFTSEAIIGFTRLTVPDPDEYLVYRIYLEGGRPSPALRRYLRDTGFSYFVLDRRIGREEPKQRLFQGYAGERSVSASALATMGRTPFLRIVHETERYLVLRIRP